MFSQTMFNPTMYGPDAGGAGGAATEPAPKTKLLMTINGKPHEFVDAREAEIAVNQLLGGMVPKTQFDDVNAKWTNAANALKVGGQNPQYVRQFYKDLGATDEELEKIEKYTRDQAAKVEAQRRRAEAEQARRDADDEGDTDPDDDDATNGEGHGRRAPQRAPVAPQTIGLNSVKLANLDTDTQSLIGDLHRRANEASKVVNAHNDGMLVRLLTDDPILVKYAMKLNEKQRNFLLRNMRSTVQKKIDAGMMLDASDIEAVRQAGRSLVSDVYGDSDALAGQGGGTRMGGATNPDTLPTPAFTSRFSDEELEKYDVRTPVKTGAGSKVTHDEYQKTLDAIQYRFNKGRAGGNHHPVDD